MKFIHFADSHLDGYKEEKLNKLSSNNFKYVINYAIDNNVDFVLIAGDLFNSALPKIDVLKETTSLLSKLKEAEIPVYCIPGSHDYSPNGKTMLDVLENAKLLINVFKGKISTEGTLVLDWTIDSKTNSHICGILGKKGMLDKEYYKKLDFNNLNSANGFKIFMFHTAIKELMPKEMSQIESYDLDILPKGFNYYAGGHIHIRQSVSREQRTEDNAGADSQITNKPLNNFVIYPGPTFPNNFGELEKLKQGSFVLYDNGNIESVKIPSKEVVSIEINCEDISSSDVEEKVEKKLLTVEVKDKIILLRFLGKLKEGKVSEINFKVITRMFMDAGAYIVLRNTSKLLSKEFDEIISEDDSEFFEEEIIKEHLDKINLPTGYEEQKLIEELIQVLDTEQYDGEKKTTFVERVISDVDKTIKK